MVEAGAGAAVAEIAEEAAGVEGVEVEEAGEEVVEEGGGVEEEVVEVEEVDMLVLVCLTTKSCTVSRRNGHRRNSKYRSN
jgi:hypothetical protein